MTIQYWHMQMHPDEMEFSGVEYILEHKKIIGLGDWEEKSNQIPQFIKGMNVNDIVAIKQGARLIALVQLLVEIMRYVMIQTQIPNGLSTEDQLEFWTGL
ncbi:hypothetical protein [Aggregatibacter actinomycetemcomitans]|uniref:hypothetical protein n=1 Tax=Aggregatibacter actinomycetemcomitans TaxID=714 RepID=UPI0007965E32|nr:hypothetical protein [Aggregatibacter actinomycetemcomitans]KYK88182.1 hypothetical protein SC29R_03720 [Aggregatibacter actinomycetemcomitans serotype f str. SC29R]